MDDSAKPDPASGLTAELAQAIFPVAPRDRRQNKDLFLDVVPEHQLKNDAAFYEGLLRIIANSDYQRLRNYDARMISAGDQRKTFAFRAWRWLRQGSSEGIEPDKIADLPEDHFPVGTPERAIHRLYRSLIGTKPATSDIAREEGSRGDAPPAEDWRRLADELREGAERLNRPDVEAADRLVELAARLAEACRAAAEMEVAQAKVAARLAGLRERLAQLRPDLPENWAKAATVEDLDRIEDRLAEAERNHQAARQAEQEREEADCAARAALEAQDYTRLGDLSARASDAKSRAERARIAFDEAVSVLVAFRQHDLPGEATTEPGPAPLPHLPEAGATAPPGVPTDDPDPGSSMPSEAGPVGTPTEEAPPEAPGGEEPPPGVAKPALSPEGGPCAKTGVEPGQPGAAELPLEPPVPVVPEPRESSGAIDTADSAELLAHYLRGGEIALAWHLARLRPTPVPAPVLRALAILPAIQQAEDMADPRFSGALAELTAALPEMDDPMVAGRLALAALLRPALFDPDHGARGHVANLLAHPGLEVAAPLIEGVAGLGYDVRLSLGLLAELTGQRLPAAEPAARQRLNAWLTEARHRKTLHQPTYAIFHRELHPQGELGRVVEAVLANAADSEARAKGLVDQLHHDRDAQEIFVSESEKRSGRPRRDRIEGMALDWFCRGLQELCDHLVDWLDARRQDARQTQDQSRERLLRAIGPVRKALEASLGWKAQGETGLAEAAGLVLATKLDDLRAVIEGRASASASTRVRDVRDLLEAPLLRLPGGCQDWTEDGDPAFDAERATRDRRLVEALANPVCIAPDEAAAFGARLKESAVFAARRLLDRLSERGFDADSTDIRRETLQKWRQQVDEALDAARQTARERVARLRQSLTTIGYLDLDAATALPGDLARLAGIDAALVAKPTGESPTIPAMNGIRRPDLPPDFPELDALLREMEARRDTLRARISERQRTELERLVPLSQGETARVLLAKFDQLDPVTVDDAIAEIKAGRAVPMADPAAPDIFTRFFPAFVRRVAAAPHETRRGQLLAALAARSSAGPIDLVGLSERRAQRLKQMLEVWGQGDNALRQSQPPRLGAALTKLFELFGFSGVRVAEGREALPRRLRHMTLTCDVSRRAEGFIAPAFGSAAGGRYQLFAAGDDVPIDQLLRQIGSEAPDAPWCVVLFGRLDVQDRINLARKARAEARSVLVLDEILLLFAGLESDDPLATLFDCATPFAWVQPYTTDPGNIPPEAFFGREAEVDRIVSRNAGGCLIYGGRQLGKSVLLNHIRRERHRPERRELAPYLDIRPIGGPGVPAAEIWRSLVHELRGVKEFERVSSVPQDIVAAIESWLDRDPARRLLALFDEADNFLRAEHASGYPNILPLKGLMERTGRRFKVVFAGLHNVRRMARAPNSPLPHLGEPICIGPMNQTEANRAALRRLAVEPMHAAGLAYADPALVSDMLARMNYYPSLVQVFGRQIVESFGRRPRPGVEGPRWPLDRDMLFEGAAAERIANQIRDRFQLTLNLDVRYDCIARSIALHRFESAGGDSQVLAQGLTPAEIRRITHWPKALAQPSMMDFEELLEELADLGVLTRFPDNRYGLRNAQVAQMLGDRPALEEALLRLDEREDDPAYDAGLFFRSLSPEMPSSRAPLSDRDLERLFDRREPGLRIVRSAAAIAGTDVAGRILAAARLWLPEGEHARTLCDDAQLRRALDRASPKSGSARVLVIEGDLPARTAAQLVRHANVVRGQVLPVWCAPLSAAPLEDAIVFDAGAWSETMLRHWLADELLAPALDDPSTRAALMATTGGAPARLEALHKRLPDLATRPVAERVAELAGWAKETPFAAEAVEIDSDDRACLETLRHLEGLEASLEDLAEECPAATETRLERLAALGMVRQGPAPGTAPILTPLGRLIVG